MQEGSSGAPADAELTSRICTTAHGRSARHRAPYALAGYSMGGRAQIIRLSWSDVDLEVGAVEWGVEWEARKYEASRRVVPTVPPLLALLRRRYME